MLILHILIAISSLFFACYSFFHATKTKLNIIYGLTALTLITGFSLVLTKQAPMTSTCQSGLVYLGVMLAGIFIIQYKLAHQKI